jgi:hypothetical protein
MPALTSTHLVECYWPDITDDKLHIATARLETATRTRRSAGSALTYVGALHMPDDETVFFLFAGAEDDVRAVSADAQVPFDRITATRWISSTAEVDTALPRRRA